MTWPTIDTAVDTTAANSNDRRIPRTGAIAITLPAPLPRTNILLARVLAAAIAAALLATAIFATGCKSGSGGGSGAGGVAAAQGSSTDPATLGTLVKSGAAPLNFRISSAGVLRILDTTDNANSLVVSTAIPASSNVNIDQLKGVSVNGTVVKAGPLPAQHRYALYLNAQQ